MTDIRVIGVPMDLGADRRGVDMGPSAIRYAGLAAGIEGLGHACTDAGDLPVPHPDEVDPDAVTPQTGPAKYLHEIEQVCARLADEVAEALEADRRPLVLGGDHSIAIGTVGGAVRGADGEMGVLWFDAHGDFNTPATTPSGNVHGMTLAAILGKGEFAGVDWAVAPTVSEENVVLVGIRDLDPEERVTVRESDATVYTMSDIDERGIADVIAEALDVATRGVGAVHVSIDLDWLDPRIAPGVGTPVRGGVTYREAHSAMELIAERHADGGAVRSLELVEVNPILDQHNETGELAAELAASALGKRIL